MQDGIECSTCHRVLPATDYHLFPDNGQIKRRKQCKDCIRATRRRRYKVRGGESKRAYQREHYRRNAESIKAYQRRYRQRHPDRVKERICRWFLANPEKRRAIWAAVGARRRMRLLSVPVEKFDPVEIAIRDNWRCHICKRKVSKSTMSLDHLMPIFHGGAHARHNVALAHRRCNSRRGPGRLPAQLLLAVHELTDFPKAK